MVSPAPFLFLPFPLFSSMAHRPRNARTTFTREVAAFLVGSCLPVITCRLFSDSPPSPPRLICGGVDQAPSSGTKRERRAWVTSVIQRQAAPLVSAVHGCYKHSADDELFLLSLILSASLYSLITCIFPPPIRDSMVLVRTTCGRQGVFELFVFSLSLAHRCR